MSINDVNDDQWCQLISVLIIKTEQTCFGKQIHVTCRSHNLQF